MELGFGVVTAAMGGIGIGEGGLWVKVKGNEVEFNDDQQKTKLTEASSATVTVSAVEPRATTAGCGRRSTEESHDML
jgi:hypothetical protein